MLSSVDCRLYLDYMYIESFYFFNFVGTCCELQQCICIENILRSLNVSLYLLKCILTFGTGVLHLIQINHQPDATVFQFIILTVFYSSSCFGRFPAHHPELNDCSDSLWFYLRIAVTVVLCSWSGRPAGRPDNQHSTTVITIRW